MSIIARQAGTDLEGGGTASEPRAGAWRPIRTVITSAFVLVPAHVFVVASALVLAASAAAERLPEGSLIAVLGAVSLKLAVVVIGVIAGVVGGLAGAAKRLVDGFEDVLRQRVHTMTAKEGARLFPSVALADARERYEAVLDRMVDDMLARIRVPRFVRRLIRRGLEQSLAEEFLADCERRGVATIGATELRNWAIATGVPRALSPIRGQIAVWRIVGLGPAVLIFALLVLVSVVGAAVSPTTLAMAVCGVTGAGVIVAGYVGASTHRRPARWRTGFAIAGTTVAAAPWIHARILPHDAVAAWIGVTGVGLLLIAYGLRLALVSADRPG